MASNETCLVQDHVPIPKERYTFDDYIEEILHLSAVPNTERLRNEMIVEMWDRYPDQCKDIGLRDRA